MRLNRLAALLATAWSHVTSLARMLWICRAAVLPVLVGVALIGLTDQARDIVIADAAPSWKGLPALLATLIAVSIWATIAWYWARVTVQYALINPPPPLPHQRWHGWLTVELPRLIGTAAMLSVALAYWMARTLYSYAGDEHANRFLVLMFLYIGIAGIFYMAVRNRERIARWLIKKGIVGPSWLPDRTLSTAIFDPRHPFARRFLITTVVAAPVFSVLVLLLPVWMSENIFRSAVPATLLGFALMVPVGCYLVMLSAKYGLPLFGSAIALLVVSPIVFGDFHDVRTLRVARSADGKTLDCKQQDEAWTSKGDNRLMLEDAYVKWWEANEKLVPAPVDGNLRAPPLVMVATAGGASRAAFWTSQVLGEIAAREPHFTDHLFMISGVSGGSLGAVTFRSLVEAHRLEKKTSTVLDKPAEKAREIIENDFLGPTFAAGLYVDLPANGLTVVRKIVPSAVLPDRGVAIEKAWEKAWEKSGAGSIAKLTWDKGFVATFGGDRPWPALVLNGTSVEKGKRIITSSIRFSGPTTASANLSSGINRYDTFDITKADIPISTSVSMSARFPVISPTGALRDCSGTAHTRVTDGGLFENFGAYTLEEVLRFLTLRLAKVQEGHYQALPVAILISSDPSLDKLNLRSDGTQSPAQPDCPPVTGDNHPAPERHPGNHSFECPAGVKDHAELFVDPILALYEGRVSRGESAATALHDRIRDAEIAVRNRLADEINKRKQNESTTPMTAEDVRRQTDETLKMLQQRLVLDNNIDFFHFRQCRVPNRKSPTMSWHDSAEAWDVLHTMLGLDKGSNDNCGNRAEFIRLCIRLARLTDGVDASNACQEKWQPR